MVDKPAADTEKYQGPGRFTAAAGDAKIWAIGGSLAGTAAGAGAASLVKPEGKIGKLIGKIASFFEGGGQSKLRGAVGEVHSSKGMLVLAGAIAGSAIFGMVGFVWGMVHGWGKGNRGEQQFNAIKGQRDDARQTVVSMQTQLTSLQSEVEMHRKKFTDDIQPRGGNVAGVVADKANTAMAEAAR